MRAFIGGAVRTLSRGSILVGGAQRRLTRALVVIGGATRTAATFLQPFSVSTPAERSARAGGNGIATATVTATVAGGLGPYSYTWARVSGDPLTLGSTASATVTVTGSVGEFEERSCVVRVTATDALGAPSQSLTTVTLRNIPTGGTS